MTSVDEGSAEAGKGPAGTGKGWAASTMARPASARAGRRHGPAGAGEGPLRDAERQRGSRWAIDVRPLRVPAYRRLWIGNSVSTLGFQFTAVAVPVEMYVLTGSSFWVGMLGVAGFLPLLVFGLWGGALADAFDRRRLLLSSSALAWAATFALLAQALLWVGSPVLLLALVAVQSAAFAVSSPTRQAIIPRLVPTHLVPAANTLGFTTYQASMVLGPLIAGLIFAAYEPAVALPVAYGVDALLFAVSLWAVLRLPALPPQQAQSPLGAVTSGSAADGGAGAGRTAVGLRSVVDGIRYLATTPVLMLSFAIDVIAMVLAMPRALFPEIAQERFGGGAAIGWLYSAISVGSVLGGLTSGWISRVSRQGLALVVAVVGWGLAVAVAGLARQLWLVVVLLALAGLADLVSAVFRQSILQVYAPDRMRGRLQGVHTTVVAGGPRLGDLRAGSMAAAFGVGAAWVAGGLASAALAAILAVAFPTLVRYRTAGEPPGRAGR